MWVKPGKGLEFGSGVQYQQDVTTVISSYRCTSIAAMNNLSHLIFSYQQCAHLSRYNS